MYITLSLPCTADRPFKIIIIIIIAQGSRCGVFVSRAGLVGIEGFIGRAGIGCSVKFVWYDMAVCMV